MIWRWLPCMSSSRHVQRCTPFSLFADGILCNWGAGQRSFLPGQGSTAFASAKRAVHHVTIRLCTLVSPSLPGASCRHVDPTRRFQRVRLFLCLFVLYMPLFPCKHRREIRAVASAKRTVHHVSNESVYVGVTIFALSFLSEC